MQPVSVTLIGGPTAIVLSKLSICRYARAHWQPENLPSP